MKINEFITTYKKNKMQSVEKLIETKKYLQFVEKEMLVNSVLDKCKIEENGFIKFDEIKQYIVFTTEIIQAYTNLEFDEEYDFMIDEYDELCENDMLNEVVATFEGEYKTVLNILNMKQEYMLQDNSVEYQIASFFNTLNGQLGNLAQIFASKLDSYGNINGEDLKELTGLLKKLK